MDVSRPEHYYWAALERIKQAEYLYREGSSYALSMYVSGVAVESMLRAFRAKETFDLESRHDILRLFTESGMLRVGEETLAAKGWATRQIEKHVTELRTAVNDVYLLWHNNYRWASEERLVAHLKWMKLYRGVKGDVLKAKALELFEAASVLIKKGVLQWR